MGGISGYRKNDIIIFVYEAAQGRVENSRKWARYEDVSVANARNIQVFCIGKKPIATIFTLFNTP